MNLKNVIIDKQILLIRRKKLNTFQLSCFLTVADTLSFARAAEVLNITQPAVTHQIHSLEAELNVRLFERTTRTVRLTHEGLLFLTDARSINALADRAKKRFEYPDDDEIRIFSIGCHNYTPLFLLTDVLRSLAGLFPQIHPRLEVVPFLHLYRLLEEGDVDVIVGFQQQNAKKSPGIYRELKKIPVVCACSSDHPLAGRKSIHIEELAQEKLILITPSKLPAGIARLQNRLMNDHRPSDFYFCDSFEASAVLTRSGFGISILPELMLPPHPDIIRLPVSSLEEISFGAYYRNLSSCRFLRPFLDLMKDSLNTIP